jgi:TetR/AcrR family transcriptional repressor of nem operon
MPKASQLVTRDRTPDRPRDLTRDRILDVAQRLVQSRGFSGFSYADIAAKVGIRKASIHHHFPTKGALGRELMVRYRAAFRDAFTRIDRGAGDARSKLQRYCKLFADVLRDDHRMCMCGMLAADFDSLPKSVRDEVRGFFDDSEAWLTTVLEEGREARTLSFEDSARIEARIVLSTLEGAMLVARSHGEVALFEAVARRIVSTLAA